MTTTAWTTSDDVADRWRPLTPAELERAPGVIGTIERGIARRWPDVQARLDAGTLDRDSLHDVVGLLARQALEIDPDIPLNATQWARGAGTESENIKLDGSLAGRWLTFDDWMVEILDNPAEATATTATRAPLFHAPKPSRRLERALHDDRDLWDLREFEERY